MRATGSATSNDWLARMSSDNWPWFRLYIDWISHPKVQRLSEADQRRFVCLMCMQSAGRLKRSSIGDIAFELRISEDEAEATVSRLKSAKLLDRDGGVHNWDQRQPKRDHSAKRTAKYRQRKALRDSGVESPAGHGDADVTRCDGHGDALDQRIEDEDNSRKEIPPTPRRRGAPAGVVEIVEHLNRITGKAHSTDKAVKEIEGALSRGATVAECCEVLDYCWREWRDNPKMVGHVDKTTPFRKANFDRYLDAARAGRVTTSTAPENDPIPREVLANLEFEMADGTDIEAWLANQRPGWVPVLRERASRMAGERR